jgi:hypothetical protein
VAIALAVNMLGRGPLACETEVSDLEATLKVDEDVGGLQVKVDVPRVVDEGQTLELC